MKTINFLRNLFGFTYIANSHTKEIHDSKNESRNCNLALISKKHFVTKRKSYKLMKNGYNGCRWCMKEFDRG